MTLTLRQVTRSRPLRALGVLAWLLLVINSLAAAPPGMAAGHVSHPARVAAAHAAPVPMPAMPAVHASCDDRSCCKGQAGCCDGLTNHGCSCAAVCSSSLPPASLMALVPAAMGTSYALPPVLSASSRRAAPPLRPPVA
jgi:hypothetical protein